MAQTTFSGPVKSLAGFISAGVSNSVTTAAGKTLTVADDAGKQIYYTSTATADNDINAIKNMGMIPEGYRVNHFLTDTDAFFIMTDAPNGLKHFVRSPIKTAIEGDFDTGNVRFKARERYVFGFSDPRGIFGSPGAA